jgi:hypothetical protein
MKNNSVVVATYKSRDVGAAAIKDVGAPPVNAPVTGGAASSKIQKENCESN